MPVRDTSKEALEKIKKTIGHDDHTVYSAIFYLGPTHDRAILAYLNRQEAKKHRPPGHHRTWEINSVTGRRNHLVALGLIWDLGKFTGIWQGKPKTYHLWKIVGDTRTPKNWTKSINELKPPSAPAPSRRMEIRERAEEPILQALRLTEQLPLFA